MGTLESKSLAVLTISSTDPGGLLMESFSERLIMADVPSLNATSDAFDWKAFENCWLAKDYPQAEALLRQAIENGQGERSHYWYLGLALLLQEQEEEAQLTWMAPLMEAEEDQQQEAWTLELVQVLDYEASQYAEEHPETAWVLRQHIHAIAPQRINNNLLLLLLAIDLERFQPDDIQNWQIVEGLQFPTSPVNAEIVAAVLDTVFRYGEIDETVVQMVTAAIPYVSDRQTQFIHTTMQTATRVAFAQKKPDIAVQLGELCLSLLDQPSDQPLDSIKQDQQRDLFIQLSSFYQDARRYPEAISAARQSYELSTTSPQKLVAIHRCLSSQMLTGGAWHKGDDLFQKEQELLQQFIAQLPEQLDSSLILRLMTTTFFHPYFQDSPQHNRKLQNQIMAFCQEQLQTIYAEQAVRYRERSDLRPPNSQAPLNVGYLSHCLKRHSVGWISRWLLEHHNREQVRVHLYLVGSEAEGIDPMQDWFVDHAEVAHRLPADPVAIADQIHADHIDILVELDSITLDATCAVLALKPAPIQVSWLGWDAPGLPAVDYYLVDPHVVPDEADEYYTEKLWRLPQTYVAVDGFEIGVPTLRRDTMDLPSDAVIYLSTQRGHKLHPDTVRLQLQIIAAVPNSYLLVKAAGQQTDQKEFWFTLAQETGVSSDRLRFLPEVPSELTHRANLQLADVLLDTYPYNGATTTLETLWLGLPLVTRVGQQFSSRNSYTMMKNAGISEGIAWSDEEYVQWGIRFGRDRDLRQSVRWKLHQSKQTSPLWNAEAFTQELESAYQQMWGEYCQS